MVRTSRDRQSSFQRAIRAALQLSLFLLVFAWPFQAMGRQRAKESPSRTPGTAKNISGKTKHVPKNLKLKDRTPKIMSSGPEDEITMQFTLDWTDCQIHRINTAGPLEIILNGTIESNSPEIWTLSPVLPKPEITPDLHFVSGVNGEVAGDQDRKAPLEWMISLDKGMFEPMTILPDNSMTYTFPPGKHSFQVRIRGKLEKNQANGYYHLQLAQSFVPQL